MAPVPLIARLEVRRLNTLAAEHRLAKQRQAIDRALTRLRTGESAPYVLLWLAQQGVRISLGNGTAPTAGDAAGASARETHQEVARD